MVPVFEVNCCLAPRVRLVLVGEIVVATPLMTVTIALAEPPGPVAVTVAVPDAGQVDGAV